MFVILLTDSYKSINASFGMRLLRDFHTYKNKIKKCWVVGKTMHRVIELVRERECIYTICVV